MSLYGMLRTGVSGMNAQSNKLATISDNIANSGTTGYKRASTEFSSLLLQSNGGQYNSGAVNTDVRYAVSAQGASNYTTSGTDLMIQGSGFFVVQDSSNQTYLTRAGSFQVDASTGNLVNTAGFTLMGYDISGGTANVILNSTEGMVPVNLAAAKFSANPTTEGVFGANLPLGATPSVAINNQSSSLTTYDNLGNAVTLDITFSYAPGTDAVVDDPATGPDETAAAVPGTWTMSITNRATGEELSNQALSFDGTGNLDIADPTLDIAIPGGSTMVLDISNMTNLNGSYTPTVAEVNGNAASLVKNVSIGDDGIVSALDSKGNKIPLYQIPLALVASPDNLQPRAGNVFLPTTESGNIQMATANEGGAGYVQAGALENSTVDMATELTEMIVAQRDYTANSKVVQTGSELLDVLMNLKR
ncbi:flagellar hook protein FlgE [Aquabacter cavernae]|uniref:flagellar hook protein FlgE n=1 Tax=Aquabacter cavernae TaxID=2496029 RepID=UPI000F8E57F8|nr:flagellar hook protein FlgE [Aquabacter cavernae]